MTGPVLGAFQALVLGRHVRRAGVWLWANVLAWGVAMPLLFAGRELVPWQTGGGLVTALATHAVCAAAGMAAGAVHGQGVERVGVPGLQVPADDVVIVARRVDVGDWLVVRVAFVVVVRGGVAEPLRLEPAGGHRLAR